MLRKENIDRIKNYQYTSIDSSLVSKYYDKICCLLIYLIPKNISPNIISLVGLFHVILSTLIIIYLASPIKYLICAYLLFVYQLCDTLDGKQGKRTNMYYNSTTELYDHGIDSMVMSLSLLNFSLILPMSHTWRCLAFFAAASTFYLPTWEHVHLKIMDFRFALFNPTEALLCTEIMYVVLWFKPELADKFIHKYIIFVQIIGVIWLYITCFKKIYNIQKMITKEQIITIMPMFITSIIIFYHGSFLDYAEIILIWNHAIISLIWKEISGTKYEIKYFILVLLRYLFAPNLILAILSYIYLFSRYSRLICDVYGMSHFWTIPTND